MWIVVFRGKDGEIYEMEIEACDGDEAKTKFQTAFPEREFLEVIPNDPDARA